MSRLSGWLSPELRAGLDAVLAKRAAAGMCNRADEDATVEGTPGEETIDRLPQQRRAQSRCACRDGAPHEMSGEFGSHQGLPVTITATVELKDLQATAGVAHTGGGDWLPMRDVLPMAAHAHNFLLIFDGAKPVALYRGRSTRLATATAAWSVTCSWRAVSATRSPGCRRRR